MGSRVPEEHGNGSKAWAGVRGGLGGVWSFGRAQIACHGSGALFHGSGVLFHGSGALFHGSGALFHGSGALFHGPVSGPLHQQMASKRPQKTLFCIKNTPKTLHTPQNACFHERNPATRPTAPEKHGCACQQGSAPPNRAIFLPFKTLIWESARVHSREKLAKTMMR